MRRSKAHAGPLSSLQAERELHKVLQRKIWIALGLPIRLQGKQRRLVREHQSEKCFHHERAADRPELRRADGLAASDRNVDIGFVEKRPRDSDFPSELDAEINRLENFLL